MAQAGISQETLNIVDSKLRDTFAKISDDKIIRKANKSLTGEWGIQGWPNRLEVGFSFRFYNLCSLFNGKPSISMPKDAHIKDLPAVNEFKERLDHLNVKLDEWAFVGGVHYARGAVATVWPHIWMDMKVKDPSLILKS